ncbi:unnamed protein product [Urochloa humidicola]
MPPGACIEVLPDEVLQHILGFLEAHESVRTCVLARRWCHLWKSATGLRVIAGTGKFLGSVEKFCNFMDILLRQRPGDGVGNNGCVLLKGLSEAKDLALISEPKTYIFKKDLRWCPIFSKLKTLLLNEYWCVPDDFRALVCILEHSPVLEKLTLELSSKKHMQQRERKGTLRPMEGSAAILEHLKIIEVRCDAVDERICKLTLFLCAFHIRLSLK